MAICRAVISYRITSYNVCYTKLLRAVGDHHQAVLEEQVDVRLEQHEQVHRGYAEQQSYNFV